MNSLYIQQPKDNGLLMGNTLYKINECAQPRRIIDLESNW